MYTSDKDKLRWGLREPGVSRVTVVKLSGNIRKAVGEYSLK